MNERKIIDRKLLTDLAKEVGLNASHLEALGESRQWEIGVGDDMLERLVDIQHQFERLAVMGDDEYRAFTPMETRWFYVASNRYGDSRSIRVTDRKHTHFIITNRSKCTDAEPDDTWCRENLTRLFDYLQRMIDVVVVNPDGFNDYVAHNLRY